METKREAAAVLAVLMIAGSLSVLGGCKKNNEEVIREEDTWYYAKEIDLNTACDISGYDSVSVDDHRILGDYILVSYTLFKYDNETVSDDKITCIFDSEGELINSVDLKAISGDYDEEAYMEVLGCSQENDVLYCYYSENNWEKDINLIKRFSVDPSSGNVGEPEDVDFALAPGERVEEMAFCDDYTYIFKCSGMAVILYAYKDGELLMEKEVRGFLSYEGFAVDGISRDGDMIRFYISNASGTIEYEYDVNTNDFKRSGSEKYYSGNGTVRGFDGRYYTTKSGGIYVDDELYLSFGDTDGNLYKLACSKLERVQEDRIYLYFWDLDFDTYKLINNMTILKKADKNPNAGKILINAESAFSTVDEMTAEGIRKYNSEDNGYYIRTMSEDYYYGHPFNYSDEEEWKKYEDDFKMRILSDDGPDIIFQPAKVSGLNSGQYLMDLSEDIVLDTGSYYTNIIDKLKVDDKLYSIPLSFRVEGILTDRSLVKDGAKGFTFEEYKELVSTICNGDDPMNDIYSKEDYLLQCLSTSGDLWFKDGKVDFDQEAFRETAEYIKDNVPDKANLETEEGSVVIGTDYLREQTTRKARAFYMLFTSDLLRETSDLDEPVILGFPSSDGRGCMAKITESVAICSSAKHKDACIDFIKMLLSPEIQELNLYNPVNREAAEFLIDKAVSSMDEYYERCIADPNLTQYDLHLMGVVKAPEGARENYLKTLDSVECVYTLDTAMSTIVSEEARAYFSGQMDIDTFIKNLEDRVQTVLDEKKE